MSDADDVAIGLAKAFAEKNVDMESRIQAHIERAFGRAILKLGLVGLLGIVVGAGTTIWKVSESVNDYRNALNGLERQITDLSTKVAPVPSIQAEAINAQRTADVALATITGHLSPDPKAKR